MSSILASLKSFMPWSRATASSSAGTNIDVSSSEKPPIVYSMIEIDGNLYYLGSMHIDDCILNFSHTMSTGLLDTFVKYATGLSNEKITTIVFKHNTEASQDKRVVGFWHPQLSKFVLMQGHGQGQGGEENQGCKN